MEIVYIAIGIICGLVIAWFIYRRKAGQQSALHREELLKQENAFINEKSELSHKLSVLEERANNLQKEKTEVNETMNLERQKNENLTRSVSISATERKNLEERLTTQKQELEELQKKFTTEFENIATKILKENTKEFTTSNQKNMSDIMSPIKEKLMSFEKKVEETYDRELRDKISLKEEVKKLYDLNSKISDEANNLTKALKGDVKKQGNWGEVVLERILERSGLTKGQEYDREVVMQNSEGQTIRPDVIIHLPEEKHVIVDSKVSLIAYERYVNSIGDVDAEKFQKEHIVSMKAHVKELAEKHYQSSAAINSPDFVLMFMPIESSFAMAVQYDQELFNYAWDNKIVIVSPSTLLATLRTIASIWKQEQQNRNVLEIAKQGGLLYDKFVGFVEDMINLGRQMDTSKKTYATAMNKLTEGSGNLIRRAENIRELGAKVKKKLPQSLIDRINDTEAIAE
ncbi:DNA recombination protein RmuC [Labilibaculum sp. A4]|uniref:DNA recombination protein RmuC n=1 Tax=Labilibaculum euxinus TaxID=2686357 RepID=A0A425YD94_9BACT|nr:DNA recombination protein RmuC [Labilibaculum euxinus]MDQ1769938.1 DNA recombination protein RmuC [Labilibaculum euxinus]MUP37922.1 DNA recombination protein RmuC [Labilibaculum euxinus]MVB07127.1 DNA recombination protein RmuC [Labilibaculum euxinus]MWN76493.1 DNA recombination protein RmuC [Labilibaculum euxinus]